VSTVPETEREKWIDDGEIALQGKREGQIDRHHHRALKIRISSITKKKGGFLFQRALQIISLCVYQLMEAGGVGCFDWCVL
jgi:hypothetical protein